MKPLINMCALQQMDNLKISALSQLLTITSSLLDSSIKDDEAVTEESMVVTEILKTIVFMVVVSK